MIVYDVATKVLDTELFPQHNIAGLISGITFIVLFQSGETFTVEGNTHIYTDTEQNSLRHNDKNDISPTLPFTIKSFPGF